MPYVRRIAKAVSISLVASLVLPGCGAEVAGTAATAAKLEAASVEKAKVQGEQLKQELEAAVKAREAAASAAEQ